MSEGKINAAMGKIMAEVGAIGKNQKNTTQNFKFRGIDDVMNELHETMAKAKVFIRTEAHYESMVREVKQTRNGAEVTYTLLPVTFHFTSAEDGSEVAITTVGEGMDSGDKGVNKAESIALKYACLQAFMIPTDDMAEPDRESFETVAKPKQDTIIVNGKEMPKRVYDATKHKVKAKDAEGNEVTETLGKIYKKNRHYFDSLGLAGDPKTREMCAIIAEYALREEKKNK